MQTLTPGSFLKLENQESVEALKFTARRLAEHTASVVAENLPLAALANLAGNLWEKAEYVARETEQRRLREIFAENFTERFRELKPEISLADAVISEVLSAAATTEKSISVATPATAPEIGANGESETMTVENVSLAEAQPETDATEVEGKRDEFLGFVKTDEPFAATPAADAEATMATAPVEAEQETARTADTIFSETSKTENESAATEEQTNSESEQAAAEQKVSAESESAEKSPPAATTAKVPAGNEAQVGSANKTSALKTETKEPFEFGKSTISLNLVLLPSSADGGNGRKAIISFRSHNQPPEIEFLEIKDGEDLNEIAELVRGKLAAFKNGLPAKYIEQLRQSKTNRAKKAAPTVRTPLAVPTKTAANQSNAEKTSSAQTAQSSSGDNKAGESRTEITATKEAATTESAPAAAVPQSITAANNVQPSLF